MTAIIVLLMAIAVTLGLIMLGLILMNIGPDQTYNAALGMVITFFIILGLETFALALILLE